MLKHSFEDTHEDHTQELNDMDYTELTNALDLAVLKKRETHDLVPLEHKPYAPAILIKEDPYWERRQPSLERMHITNFINDLEQNISEAEQTNGSVNKRYNFFNALFQTLRKIHTVDVLVNPMINMDFLYADENDQSAIDDFITYYDRYLRQISPRISEQVLYIGRRYTGLGGCLPRFTFPSRYKWNTKMSTVCPTLTEEKKIFSSEKREQGVSVNVEEEWWENKDNINTRWLVRFQCQDEQVAKRIQALLEAKEFSQEVTKLVKKSEVGLDKEGNHPGMSPSQLQAFEGNMFHVRCRYEKDHFLWNEYIAIYLYMWPTYQWKQYSTDPSDDARYLINHNFDMHNEYFREVMWGLSDPNNNKSVIFYPWIDDDDY
jgi:hypothetical protein